MRDIRTAIAVFNAKVGQTRENLNRTVRLTRQAAAEGAELICFPEMNITGYSNHPDILDLAEPIPGPSIKDLIVLSRKEKIVILAGLAEKGVDGNIYASHAVITPDGLNGVYRKLHIAPTEQAMYTAGKQIPIFEYKGIKFGIQLCYDAHFPELSTRMAALGVAVIFIPHASPRGKAPEKHRSWMRHLPARAYDNSLFMDCAFPEMRWSSGPPDTFCRNGPPVKKPCTCSTLKPGNFGRCATTGCTFFCPIGDRNSIPHSCINNMAKYR
ncbi:MAG: nitrilase [Deltaproteobacteria bacterium]|nr:nitrilase [Deltaproteobacteria bacterium]